MFSYHIQNIHSIKQASPHPHKLIQPPLLASQIESVGGNNFSPKKERRQFALASINSTSEQCYQLYCLIGLLDGTVAIYSSDYSEIMDTNIIELCRLVPVCMNVLDELADGMNEDFILLWAYRTTLCY